MHPQTLSAFLGICLFLLVPTLSAGAGKPPLEEEAVAVLQRYIQIDTSNPPGRTTKAVDFLEKLLKQEGIATKRYITNAERGTECLLARLPGRGQGKPLLMLSHMDVVPANPAVWKYPPFSGKILDGELWGRGAIDMKGLGIMELFAMIALKREGFKPSRDLLLLFNADEEAGGEWGAHWMVKNAWADLDPDFILDEGGAGTQGIYTDDNRIVYGIAVAEKGVLWLKLRAEGDSGHGSRPTPRNAVAKLTQALARIDAIKPKPRVSAVVAEMRKRIGKLADNPTTRALGRTTITLTTLRAGVGDPPKVNVIPGKAEATIDCRLLPEDSPDLLLARIKACLENDPDLSLEVLQWPHAPPPPNWDNPLYKAIEALLTERVPGSITVPALMTGGTDARFFRDKGVPSMGFDPTVRNPDQQKLFHGDNERISLSEFKRGLGIYRELLARFLE